MTCTADGTAMEGLEGKRYIPVVLQVGSVRLLLELGVSLVPPSRLNEGLSNIGTA